LIKNIIVILSALKYINLHWW